MEAWPNPTRGAVNFRYSLPSDQSVKLRVTDIAGNVIDLQQLSATEGWNQLEINLADAAAGVYFATLRTEIGMVTVKKLLKE